MGGINEASRLGAAEGSLVDRAEAVGGAAFPRAEEKQGWEDYELQEQDLVRQGVFAEFESAINARIDEMQVSGRAEAILRYIVLQQVSADDEVAKAEIKGLRTALDIANSLLVSDNENS